MRKAARLRLPPLGTLEPFVAAARLGSLSAAAAELNLTPGAVSRQVAALEADLGVALFIRLARGVEVTSAGRRLEAAATEALALLRAATGDLRHPQAMAVVRISVTPSFGTRWLLPRLARFHAAHPGVKIVPVAENRLVDLVRDDFDIAVRYSAGPPPQELECVTWLSEELVPVVAPAMLTPAMGTLESLATLPFLHDTSDAFWRAWLAAIGRPELLPGQGTVFNDYNLAVGAAVAGLGVLVGRTALIEAELNDGLLVEGSTFRVPSPRAYRLLRPAHQPTRAASAFWDWLIGAARSPLTAPAPTPPGTADR